MVKPLIAADEPERLAVLRRYGVLDTPPEKELDDLVALAAHICSAAISQITLVDERRQWFKASFGIARGETPRDYSFCAHAIHQPGILVVPDATQDDRFFDNPLVVGAPHIRFYAGSPLVTPDGKALGTLCVIDPHPRPLTEEQRQALHVLSRMAMSHLEMRLQTRESTQAARALARNEVRLRAALSELTVKNAELERASTMKSRFLASMSHELRTPLNCIIGFSEILRDGASGPVNEQQKEHLGDILTSGHHLLSLINDVLDLAKVEAGKMEVFPKPFPLAAAVSETVSILRPIAQKKALRLSVEIAPEAGEVTLDPKLFKQALYNLLSNAVKFTGAGGAVELRVAPAGAERFSVSVRDTGIGIKPENLSRLFREFEQLDDGLARVHQGTGLGLALTRRIVEVQGGSIAVESEFGAGSLFTVTLPRVLPTPAPPGEDGSAQASA